MIYEVGSKSSWSMFSGEEYKWVSKIDSAAKNHIEDFFKVKVGIKSTADKVFISDNWDDLKEIKPEEELLKDLISQENINAWHATNNSKLKVLYPHICVNGKKTTVDIHKYPNAEIFWLTFVLAQSLIFGFSHKEDLQSQCRNNYLKGMILLEINLSDCCVYQLLEGNPHKINTFLLKKPILVYSLLYLNIYHLYQNQQYQS